MAKASPIQSNFSGGEVSPLYQGQVEADRYKISEKVALNFVATLQGGLPRRPGTKFVAETKFSDFQSRLQRFEFSTTQAYILEFGHLYIRFYKDNAQILNLGVPYEIVTLYPSSHCIELSFTQSADILYAAHVSHPPRKITRTGHTAWTITDIDFLDGPYMAVNNTATTLTPGGTSGSVNITASSTTGINNNTGFQTGDVGRLIRIKASGGNWSWAKITARISTTQVTATIRGPNMVAAASAEWRLGLWSNQSGWPTCVAFHEDRLIFGTGQRIDMSNSGDYENFAPTDAAGAVISSYALSFTLNSRDVQNIRWFISEERGLFVGTASGEWIVRPSVQVEGLDQTNISAKQTTGYGSALIEPVVAGKSALFVTRSKKKLRELTYTSDTDTFRCPDRTVLAEHISGSSGFRQLAFTKDPHPVLWAAREDGVLTGMTYDREEDVLILGWHRQVIGGTGDLPGQSAHVESVAVIPSPDGTRDELWMTVRRKINGSTKRYVEYMTPFSDENTAQRDLFFVDSGLTYDSPLFITGITQANPAVLTTLDPHLCNNGDKVLVVGVARMTEVNNRIFTVRNKTATTMELEDSAGNPVNSTSYGAFLYNDAGKLRKLVSTVSGLGHLEGETVAVVGDGAAQVSKVVTAGAITLESAAATVHVGFGYNSDAQLLRIEAGAADGTALGKLRRVHRIAMLLHRTNALKIGMSFSDLTEITFRRTNDALGMAVPLFSGIRVETIEADADYDNEICFRVDKPLPCTLLAVATQLKTEDSA